MLAVVLVALVEVVLRQGILGGRLLYHPGRREYLAVRDQLTGDGAAQVSFIGSSRTREGIVAPRVREMLSERLGRPVIVACYACGGARAEENEWIVRKMLAARTKPEVILYGVSPRQLLGRRGSSGWTALLWDLRDWREQLRLRGGQVGGLLPTVIRNEIKKHYLTFACRDALKQVVLGALGRPRYPCPILGELSPTQQREPDVSLVSRGISDADVRSYLRNVLGPDGRYECSQAQIDAMRSVVRQCRQVGVRLVLFELPVSELLRRNLPPGRWSGSTR